MPFLRTTLNASRSASPVLVLVLVLALAAVGAPLAAPAVAAADGAVAIDNETPTLSPTTAGPPVDGVAAAAEAPRHAVGATVVGIEAFSLIGLTLPEAAEPSYVRVRSGGTWSTWHELHFGEDHAPEESEAAGLPGAHSDPIWVGVADGYQLVLPAGTPTPTVHLARESGAAPRAATASRVSSAEDRAVTAEVSAAASPYDYSPGVQPRSAWGARPGTQTAVEANDLRVAFVHHSVTTNSYSTADVPGILRGIQAYHMDANGWSDIGYNFAVDRFGGIWEARHGGIIRAIVGGHAQGFNTTSVGVVMLGDFSSVSPPAAATNAVAEIIAWRFAVAGVDPRGSVFFTTSTGSTKYPPGTTVELNRVSGHRDVGLTACPGALGYATLDAIRSRVASRYVAYAGNVPTRWLTSPTHRYTDLRGESPSQLDIAATTSGRLEATARGLDDQLWVNPWDGGRWVGWQPVGGVLRSGPATVGSSNGQLDVFVVGGDGGLYHRVRSGGGWSGWNSLGGQITATPDAVRTSDGVLVVVGRGLDGGIWLRYRIGVLPWSPWITAQGNTPAGGGPAVASLGAGRLDLFIRGLDDRLWSRTMAPGGLWGAWQPIGGRLASSPAAASAGAETIDVVVRGGDGRLYDARRISGGWTGWQQISREAVGTGAGLVSMGPGRLDLVTTTPDGRAFQTWWSSAGW